uniref:hypothetical protein n=1 Tax=Amycolatopsis sp. CA-290885 TaxID=3239925 RepID=UPI003F497A86
MDAIEYMRWLEQQSPEVQAEQQRAAVARMDATKGGWFDMSPEDRELANAAADQAEQEAEDMYDRAIAEREAQDVPEAGQETVEAEHHDEAEPGWDPWGEPEVGR